MEEGVYIIHTRECLNANLPIYKLGRSNNLGNRVKQYPMGSNIMFMIYCSNSILCEKNLITLFVKLFTRKKTYGNEYFEGDINEMIFTIFKYLYSDKFVNKSNNIQPINNIEPVKNVTKVTEDIENKDRKCPNKLCCQVFQYPSGLRKHFKSGRHCYKTNSEIDEFFSNIKQKKKDTNICNICNIFFTKNSLLLRHQKSCNAKTSKILTINKEQQLQQAKQSQELQSLREQIEELKEQIKTIEIKKVKPKKIKNTSM